VANRGRTGLEPLLGFFVNLLPLRAGTAAAAADSSSSADPSFGALVERVRDSVLAGFERQDLPFERLVEELNPERRLGVNPICQAVFQLLDRPTPAPLLAGLRVTAAEVPDAATRVDLVLTVTRTPDGLTGALECAADLFDPATGRALADRFALLLTGALDDPSLSLAELTVVTAAERRALLAEPPELGPTHRGDRHARRGARPAGPRGRSAESRARSRAS
jgi:non-ribosomal peptide synthetase component F